MLFFKIFYILILINLIQFTKWAVIAFHIKTSDTFMEINVKDSKEFQDNPLKLVDNGKVNNGSWINEDVGPASYLYHHLHKRQANPPQNQTTNKQFEKCFTPTGEQGSCRHIIYCRFPELQDDIWRLVAHLCVVDGRTVGICCPERFINPYVPQINNNLRIDSEAASEAAFSSNNNQDQRGCGAATMQFSDVNKARQSDINEWPWVAAIIRPGFVYVWCGGVLVTDRHVLTAAHCIHKFNKYDLLVRLGEYNTELTNETRARNIRVADMITHIDYDPFTYHNDIGIIRLEQPTIFNTYIWPICMPPLDEMNLQEQVGIVAGWGSKNFGGPHSDVLMQVALPIWKLDDCRNVMLEHISDSMLCAGYPEGGQDSCQGDSGGPLMIQMSNRRWATIGIVSWGVRCGEPNRPGVYTRVDRYIQWIIEHSNY